MTPKEVAKRYGVGINKVLAWIAAGDLRAVNVAAKTSSRPRWFISQEHLEAFERRRESTPAPSPRRKRRGGKDYRIFY